MDDTPDITPGSPIDAGTLKFLKVLVTVLTATMIIGVVTIIVLIVIRVPTAIRMVADQVPVPDVITLPGGSVATAFTQGAGWYAVVTKSNEILIFNRSNGSLRQTIKIKSR